LYGKIIGITTGTSTCPALHGNIIVWIEREEHDYVYGYNILTKETFQITSESGNPELPTVYDSVVVWYDFRNGNADIYGYCLPPSISQTQDVVSEKEKKLEKGEDGICLGTLFIALALVGGLTCLKKRKL
jgi:beta propeller repeat protein